MAGKARTAHTLTHSDVIRLSQLMLNDKELIAKQKYTAAQYAARASQILGFPVSDSSVKRIQGDVGVDFESAHCKSPLASAYVDLKKRVEQLEQKLESLCTELNFRK